MPTPHLPTPMLHHKEPIPTTQLKWGQVALMLLAAALCAVYEPIYLVYAGLLRLVWCAVAGHLGRGLLSFCAFGLVYLVVLFGNEDQDPFEDEPRAEQATTTIPPLPPPGFSSAVYVPALEGRRR